MRNVCMVVAGIALCFSVVLGVMAGSQRSQQVANDASTDAVRGELMLIVEQARLSGPGTVPVAGAEILVVGTDRTLMALGRTDEHGRSMVDMTMVRGVSSPVILVCPALCECTAVRMDEPHLLELEERVVAVTGRIL